MTFDLKKGYVDTTPKAWAINGRKTHKLDVIRLLKKLGFKEKFANHMYKPHIQYT